MISVRHATLKKGRSLILDDVTVELPSGALIAVIGPNGAGKTSLLRLMAGLDHPDSGDVLVTEKSLSQLTGEERATTLSWVPTDSPLPFAFTALETVILGRFATSKGAPGRTDTEKSRAALAALGVQDLADRTITTLSSGERQKVMVARSLAAECPVMILDEPLANLDIAASLHLLKLLKSRTALGTTVCASFHDIILARKHADYVVLLAGGKVKAVGPAEKTLSSEHIREVFGVNTTIAHSSDGKSLLEFQLP